MSGITDRLDKDSIIAELKKQVKARKDEIYNITDRLDEVINYPRFNLMYDVVRGHTVILPNSKEEIVIQNKVDFIRALVKTFHYTLDCNDFGIEKADFEKMEDEAFKEDEQVKVKNENGKIIKNIIQTS